MPSAPTAPGFLFSPTRRRCEMKRELTGAINTLVDITERKHAERVSRQKRPAAKDFLAGGGEMGALIRAKDWTRSPLGPRRAGPMH